MSDAAPTLVVAGNIATGKTSLVEALGRAMGLRTFLERWEDNPWFGAAPPTAFAEQLWFLTAAADDQARMSDGGGGVQERCIHEHALVFARERLAGDAARLLEGSYSLLDASLPDPRLLIHLEASATEILERVRTRGRSQERSLTAERLASLGARYRELIAGWTRCPVIAIDTERVDLCCEDGIRHVLALAREHLA